MVTGQSKEARERGDGGAEVCASGGVVGECCGGVRGDVDCCHGLCEVEKEMGGTKDVVFRGCDLMPCEEWFLSCIENGEIHI